MGVKKLQSTKLSEKKHTMTVESHLTAQLFAIKLILSNKSQRRAIYEVGKETNPRSVTES
jgi:hypothetical protein